MQKVTLAEQSIAAGGWRGFSTRSKRLSRRLLLRLTVRRWDP